MPDIDFTTKLVGLHPPSRDYPDGFAMFLRERLLPVRYRDNGKQPAPMTPGQVCTIMIELFLRGHRLRLDISSGNLPHFDVNPKAR